MARLAPLGLFAHSARISHPAAILCWPLATAILATASTVHAVDLTVSAIEINQADQYGTTKLFGNNVTWVRVKVGVSGSASAVPAVDAILRVYVDGKPFPHPVAPIYSLNGPITAPLSPLNGNINDTLNFVVVPPTSGDVDFVVEVNPGQTVEETNYANNSFAVNNKNFECRTVLELAYVPIDYTPNGMGLPAEGLIEPGIGDGFLRAIYHPSEWNYHKSPLPPLLWTQSINSSNSQLLNTLKDIRINQLPDAGYPQPDFVYGWLPGNPYSGNGQAIGIPGDVAFGNTDTTRHQRTFAHEIGHCFGLAHNNLTINTIGVDTERHLKDTQNLAQLFPTNKKDVMVAGQLTNAAWIAQNSYNTVHNDQRMQCGSALAGGPELVPALRISGVIDHINNTVMLNPALRIALAEPTLDDANPNMRVAAYDQFGNLLHLVSVRTGTTREMCVADVLEKPVLSPTSPLYVLIPEPLSGQIVNRIDVTELATGKLLAQSVRSPNPPQAAFVSIAAIDAPVHDGVLAPGPLTGNIRIQWSHSDADGDALSATLLYSPAPGRWLPIMLNSNAASFEFNAKDVPSTKGPTGKLKLIVSDGLNITESVTEMIELSAPQPPETYLLTPNNNDVFPELAPIAFHAAAWDMDDLMVQGDQVIWASDIDGTIGEGLLLVHDGLSPGTHQITVTATDSENNSASKEIAITITARTVVSPDCNGNGVLDGTDIGNGTSSDANGDGIPDECAAAPCLADITADSVVDQFDLTVVIDAWGKCPECNASCNADLNDSCTVDVDDLLLVIHSWGPCN